MKFLKTLALGAGALLLTTPALAQTDTYTPPADELAEAMAIMEVVFPPDTREQAMIDTATTMGNQMAGSFMTGPIFEEPGIKAIMDDFLASLPEVMRPMIVKHLPSMIKSTAIAYTREFTLSELQDIRAFATTPSGQRYFSSAQGLLADPAVAAANEAFFSDVNAAQQVEVEKIQAKVVDYLQKNPEVIERLQAAGVG
ncbi:hypothetical protein EH31_01330 [Erythrobacter longus]|uniref:Uncharacterized protein n=1 Tax=Erythrobacter longus TaxID=1044 RepID=A0A074MCX8_ERYLO|nr:DUF2059 domain-containing protein [Erythrobacter longus]KEO91334.1 hypothetical protein EH31_01330 [Erythrobacter longus]